MKTHSSHLKIGGVLSLALAFTVLGGLPTSAVTPGSNTNKTSNTCSRVTTLESTASAALTTKLTSMGNNFSDRLAKLNERKTSIDQKIKTAREKAAAHFDTLIEKMLARNLTDTQKQAVETYQTNMKSAEEVRETAVDAARTTYRSSLSSAVKTHQIGLTNAAATYQDAVKTAFEVAKTSCEDDSATMTTLRASIKSARAQFKQAREDLRTTGTAAIKSFMSTRNDAIKKANEAFAQSATEYSQALKDTLTTTQSDS